MKLTRKEHSELQKLIKRAISDSTAEFEVRINSKITHNQLTNILNSLIFSKEHKGLGLKYTVNSVLSITNNEDSVRINVNGQDSIRKYWLTNNLLAEGIEYSTELKKRKKNVDLAAYDIRVSLSEEKEGGDIKELMSQKTEKTFRCKNRYEIISTDGMFRFDLTTLKCAKGVSLRNSLLFKQPSEYEIEMEWVGSKDVDPDIAFESFIYNSALLLRLYQNSELIVTKDEVENVLEGYTRLVDIKGNGGKFKFIAANPVTLHIQHLSEDYSPSLLDEYAVTDKADGIRNFLYINEKGEGYLLDSNSDVKKINLVVPGWKGSLIEGEYVDKIKSFLAYDMLFERGNDIRSRHLYAKSSASKSAVKKTRLEYLSEFMKEKMDDVSVVVKQKPYRFASGSDIFKKAKEIWDGPKTYHIDGLIFIPYSAPYPIKGGTWNKLFKWKPETLNSIDFLAKLIRNEKGEAKRTPYVVDGQVYQYKSFNLFVGGVRNSINKKNGNWMKQSVPIPFNPPESPTDIGVANVKVNEKGQMVCQDPLSGQYYPITDDTIIEFVYKKDPIFYWVPIRVREDKTDKYRSGEPVFGNSESVANDNWLSIQNPVTIEMITTGRVPDYIMEQSLKKAQTPAPVKKEEPSYYTNTDVKQFNYSERLPFQHFHNQVVKAQLIASVSPATLTKSKKPIGSLLDLAVGKGGDLPKWKNALYEKVIGLDIDKAGLDYADNFYKEYKGKPKPKVEYIWGDSSKLIFPDYIAAMSAEARSKMETYLPKKGMFDVVSIQFAIHYMFKNEISLRTLLQNVADNLRIGGHFIGTCFDGMKVNNELKKKSKLEGKVGDNLIWSIEKMYTGSNAKNRANYGKEIRVYVSSIGESYTEYLVNLSYMSTIGKQYGLECTRVDSFEDYFDKSDHNSVKEMSEAEKQFSFLSSAFVFRKMKEPTASATKKLLQLLKDQKEVDTKEEEEIVQLEIEKK